MRFSLSAAQGLNSEQSEQGVIRSASQFMRPLTFSETVENLIRVNSWNSWGFLLATNSTKAITAIWMPSVRNTNFQSLTAGLLTRACDA